MGILKSITNYIEFLVTEKGIDISICALEKGALPYFEKFSSNLYHNGYYCQYLKKNKQAHNICLKRQEKVFEKCKTFSYFTGMCHAGVCEHIFGLYYENRPFGFISAGAFCNNLEKVSARQDRLCEKLGFEKSSLKKVFDMSVKTYNFSDEHIKTLVIPLCVMLEKHYQDAIKVPKSQGDIVYQKALLFLNENLASQIKIDDLCKHLNYSRTYLCNLFLRKSKMGIGEKLLRIRLDRAAHLILNTDLSISEIAYMCGFNDSNYFSAAFKKMSGFPPTVYRKNAI